MPLLADKFFLVAPDLRGLGDSSRPSKGYDKKTVAGDLWSLMRDHLGFERFDVVGHDWGAPTAFRLAADHADAVTHLAMLDAPVPGDVPAGSGLGGTPRWHHMFHQVPDLPEALTYGRERIYLEWFFIAGTDQAGVFSDADIAEYVRTYSQPGAMRAGFNFYRALPQVSPTIANSWRPASSFRCRRWVLEEAAAAAGVISSCSRSPGRIEGRGRCDRRLRSFHSRRKARGVGAPAPRISRVNFSKPKCRRGHRNGYHHTMQFRRRSPFATFRC